MNLCEGKEEKKTYDEVGLLPSTLLHMENANFISNQLEFVTENNDI